jgi:hypothetical protein
VGRGPSKWPTYSFQIFPISHYKLSLSQGGGQGRALAAAIGLFTLKNPSPFGAKIVIIPFAIKNLLNGERGFGGGQPEGWPPPQHYPPPPAELAPQNTSAQTRIQKLLASSWYKPIRK